MGAVTQGKATQFQSPTSTQALLVLCIHHPLATYNLTLTSNSAVTSIPYPPFSTVCPPRVSLYLFLGRDKLPPAPNSQKHLEDPPFHSATLPRLQYDFRYVKRAYLDQSPSSAFGSSDAIGRAVSATVSFVHSLFQPLSCS